MSTNLEDSEEKPILSPRLPKCFFLDTREECTGELTLDTTTLKEIWGDQRVSLALASMLKAVIEGRLSSSSDETPSSVDGDDGDDDDGYDVDIDADDAKGEESPDEGGKEAKFALVEVFQCFCNGMTPNPKTVRVLNVDSLLTRMHELSEARKESPETKSHQQSSGADESSLHHPVVLKCVKKDDEKTQIGVMEGEEETVSKLLNLVSSIRTKHKLPPFDTSSSGVIAGTDDHAMTFGIVAADRSANDPDDEEWLLVGREAADKKVVEDSIYPIHSIYSFFVVLNSDTVIQYSPSSPGSQEESEDDGCSISSSSSASMSNDDEDSGSSPPESTVFSTVKQHEESAWSILAAIHVTEPETMNETSDGNVCPDLVVIDDPLCIINEYIRYLQGEDALPREEQKRRHVHVHENVIGKKVCRIRILTTDDDSKDSDDDASKAEQREKRKQLFQERLVQEQQELLQLLEQKLLKLKQAQDLASTSSSMTSSSSDSPSPSSTPETPSQ